MTTESTNLDPAVGFSSVRARKEAHSTAVSNAGDPSWEERLAEARRKREEVLRERRMSGEDVAAQKPIIGPKPWDVADETIKKRSDALKTQDAAAVPVDPDVEQPLSNPEDTAEDEFSVALLPVDAPKPEAADELAGEDQKPQDDVERMALAAAVERAARATPEQAPEAAIVTETTPVISKAAIIAPKREPERKRRPIAAIGLIAAGTAIGFGLATAAVMQFDLRGDTQLASLPNTVPETVADATIVRPEASVLQTPVPSEIAAPEVLEPVVTASAQDTAPVTSQSAPVIDSHELDPFFVTKAPPAELDASPAWQGIDRSDDLALASIDQGTPSLAPVTSQPSAGFDFSEIQNASLVAAVASIRAPQLPEQLSTTSTLPTGDGYSAVTDLPKITLAGTIAPSALPDLPLPSGLEATQLTLAGMIPYQDVPSWIAAPKVAPSASSSTAPANPDVLPVLALNQSAIPSVSLEVPAPTPIIDLAERFNIRVHAPSGLGEERLVSVSAAIRDTGFSVSDPTRVNLKISSDQVRYFHPEDAEAAAVLADALGGKLRDFTSFKPSPPDGTIEIWMAGDSAVAPKVTRRATTTRRSTRTQPRRVDPATNLRNRIIERLRRGDHL